MKTEKELKNGVLYLSTMGGSQGFIFMKFGEIVWAFAMHDGEYITASTNHGRDFYEAPKGMKLVIEN